MCWHLCILYNQWFHFVGQIIGTVYLKAGVGQPDCTNSNGNDLNSGYECKDAGKILGLSYGGAFEKYAIWPKGCFIHNHTTVWLNQINSYNAKSNKLANPICRSNGGSMKIWCTIMTA